MNIFNFLTIASLLIVCDSAVISQCKKAGHFALTFDEGPINGLTSNILSILKAKNAPATFHISTQNFNDPNVINLAQSIAAAGQSVALRFPPQMALTSMSKQEISNVLDNNIDSFDLVLNFKPQFIRFPYRQETAEIVTLAESKGLIVTEQNLDAMDYTADANIVFNFQVAMANALPSQNSFISLQHDYSQKSADQLAVIIDMIRSKGYNLVSLAECVGIKEVTSTIVPSQTSSVQSQQPPRATTAVTKPTAGTQTVQPNPSSTTTSSPSISSTAKPSDVNNNADLNNAANLNGSAGRSVGSSVLSVLLPFLVFLL